jgi:hypothetical protein
MTDETSEATKRLGEWVEAGRGREWAIRYAFRGTAATVELTWNDGKDCGSCFATRANAEEAVYAALYDYAEQTINHLQARVKELESRQTKQAELFMEAMRERDEARTELERLSQPNGTTADENETADWFSEREKQFSQFAKSCGLDRFVDPNGERYVYNLDGSTAGKKVEEIEFMDDLWNALANAKGRGELRV